MSDTKGQHTNEKETLKTQEKKDEGKPPKAHAVRQRRGDRQDQRRFRRQGRPPQARGAARPRKLTGRSASSATERKHLPRRHLPCCFSSAPTTTSGTART